MRSLAHVLLTGTSCAVLLLHSTIAASASGTAAAAATDTSAASWGGDGNRRVNFNFNRRLAEESLPRYAESKRDDETAELPKSAPAVLHGFLLQSDPAGGLSNLRGGQQQQQQQQHKEEDGKLEDKDEPLLVLHDIFDRLDQIPELAARKGGGDGSSNEKSSKKKKTNSQRMCSTSGEKACRNNCIDNKCDASDDESSPCAKRCRHKCCSDLQRDDRSKKNGEKDDESDEERSCNTMEEKSCRSKCFYKKKCQDDECKRQCRRDCCVGGRVGSGSEEKSDDESSSQNGSKKKDAGGGDGGDSGDADDGKGCDTDVEKQCRDTCFIESSCQEGDRECRKTCRQGCCDVDLTIVDIISNAQEQDGSADDDDESLMSGDLSLSFRFTIKTAERFTADDIMRGRDNRLKEDLEGGLKILVEDVVGESFRGDGWKEESRKARRRKLVVRYQSDSPPTVEDVRDVACPSSDGGRGCKRVGAEATLELEDENENSVRQAFLTAISEAISDGRLEKSIREFNPDHGSRDPLSNNPESSNDGEGGRSLTNIQIAGIAVGALSFVVLSYLALKTCQDRQKKMEGSSAPDSVSRQEAGYEDDAYHEAYADDHYEDRRLPPVPEPPQLPDHPSGKPSESKLAAVRRELQADQYKPYTPKRALEASGPSLSDLVATSYTPNIEEATATMDGGQHASQYDYQGGEDDYDEAPPNVAESDVSSKEGAGDDGGDAMTETSSQKFVETGAGTDASGTTVRSSVSNRSSSILRDNDTSGRGSGRRHALFSSLTSRSLAIGQHGGGRTLSESALSAMEHKKSSMIVRTLDESLGRAGPVAEQSVHRRRELRRLSQELGRVMPANGFGPTMPRGSMYDGLRQSSSVHTLNDSGKSSLSVSFHNVRIREYPMTVGDNPAVSSGVAVTMDWDPLEQGSQVMELEEYEDSRPDRRAKGQMIIPPHERREILRRSGHSMKEIQRGLKASNIARRQRVKTLGTLHMQPFKEMCEKTSRAIGNAITSKKKEERDLLTMSIEVERIRQKERAEVWAEQERMAAMELGEIEAILNGEKDQQQPSHARPVCIDEDGERADIISSDISAVSEQAAVDCQENCGRRAE